MTRKEIETEIAEVEACMARSREKIDYLRSIGQSWALDCREMRIAEASLSYNWDRLAGLKASLAATQLEKKCIVR